MAWCQVFHEHILVGLDLRKANRRACFPPSVIAGAVVDLVDEAILLEGELQGGIQSDEQLPKGLAGALDDRREHVVRIARHGSTAHRADVAHRDLTIVGEEIFEGDKGLRQHRGSALRWCCRCLAACAACRGGF